MDLPILRQARFIDWETCRWALCSCAGYSDAVLPRDASMGDVMNPIKERRLCCFWLPMTDIKMLEEQMLGVAFRHDIENRREDVITHYESMVHPKGLFKTDGLGFRCLKGPTYFVELQVKVLSDDTFGLAIVLANDEFDIVPDGTEPPRMRRL